MVDPSRHADSRNIVESILRYIPGFRGYLEKEYRRESDHLARTFLADRLQRCKTSFDNHQRSLVDAGQIDELPQCERLRSRLDALESRVRGAVRGYSGFFDYVRVNEDVLDQVYSQDMALIGDVEALSQAIDGLSGSAGPPQTTVSQLLDLVEQLHRKFDQRSEILEGLDSKN